MNIQNSMKICRWICGLLLVISSLASSSILNGQSHEFVDPSFKGSAVIGMFEVEGNFTIAISNWLNPTYSGDGEFALTLYQIDFEANATTFEIEQIHYVEMEDGYQVFAIDYIDETNEWICIMANNFSNLSTRNYKVQIYSADFQPLSSQELEINGNPPNDFYIDTYKNKTCAIGYVFEPWNDKLVYMEYRHHQTDGLKPIVVGQSSPMKTFWLTSMRFDERTDNMLIFYYLGIAILDSTLYQVENHDFISIQTNDHGTVRMAGDYYFSHSARDAAWDDGRRRLVLHKYDTMFNILRADTLGRRGRDNYPFITNSMDIRDSSILAGANLDGPFNGIDFYIRPKKFYLAKYDLDLNQIWYKEFGGDRAYILTDLKLLKDGSSLASGFITDTITEYRYAYIMYVNENGDIVSSIEVPSSPGPPLTVVNPGDDQLTILNPDGLDSRIVLYTLDGKTVLNTPVLPDMSSHDLSIWPPGMYPYVFYLDDKPVKSGKWVKKE